MSETKQKKPAVKPGATPAKKSAPVKSTASTSAAKSKTSPKKITSQKSPTKKAPSKKTPTPRKTNRYDLNGPDRYGLSIQDPDQTTPRRTIAQRTVRYKRIGGFAIFSWIAMLLLLLLALYFFFVAVGYDFSGMVCLGLIGILAFYEFVRILSQKFPRGVRILRDIFTVFLCAGLLVAAITEGLILRASFGNPEKQVDYMVVLGAKVRPDGPSLSLQNRIDAAYDYMIANPHVIAVVSGGQGEDEVMEEAQCMYNELTQMGISPSRIWIENRATSTWENLKFSLDLIEEKTGSRPASIGVISSEYHLYRASLFAKECGAAFVGIPAKTTKISLRVNYFLREIAGVWHYLILGGNYHA